MGKERLRIKQKVEWRKKNSLWLGAFFLLVLFLCLPAQRVCADSREDDETVLPIDVEGTYFHDEEFKVLDEINKRRDKVRVDALKMDSALCDAAMERAAELAISYGNVRPDDSDYTTALSGLYEEDICEIYLYGPTGARLAMKEWEKNFSARLKMDDSGYESAGIACFRQNGTYYWLILLSDRYQSEKERPDSKHKMEQKSTTVQVKKRDLTVRYLAPTSNAAIKIGETMQGTLVVKNIRNNQCQASISPSAIDYMSSDPSVASVDKAGVIKGIATGSAVITARLKMDFSVGSSFIVSVSQERMDISKAVIAASPSALYYTGTQKRPQIILTYAGISLKEGTDYTINYRNNVNVGDADVNIIGYGGYSGKTVFHFPIKTLNLEKADLSLDKNAYNVTGSEIYPEVTLRFAGTDLVKDRDYTVEYSDNVKIGNGKVTITGINNCEGTVERKFEIRKSSWYAQVDEKLFVTESGIVIRPQIRMEDDYPIPENLEIKSSDSKVARPLGGGEVKIIGAGRTKLTLVFPETDFKKEGTREIVVTVHPGKVKKLTGKVLDGQNFLLKWKKTKGASGYVVEYSKTKNFKKCHMFVIRNAKEAEQKIHTLEKGKKWYVRMKAYVLCDGDRYYGPVAGIRVS